MKNYYSKHAEKTAHQSEAQNDQF